MRDPSGVNVVLLHGLLGTPREFALVGGQLRARGIAANVLEVAGYTGAARSRGRSTWMQWLDAARLALDNACRPNAPLIVGGLCTGGLLSAALALEGTRRVDGLVLVSPTLAFDGWGLPLWHRLRHLAYLLGLDRYIRVREREPFGIKNPAVRNWIAQDLRARYEAEIGPGALPLWSIRQSERLTRHVLGRIAALRCPLLVIHAREDEITRLATVQATIERLPLADKRFVVVENSYHVVTIDNDHRRVADEVARFAHDVAARDARCSDPRCAPVPIARP